MINEVWRDIEGYEGYQVSNLGKVRSLDRIDSLGRLKLGKILSPRMNGGGYLRVNLYQEGKLKHFLIHRLVAIAFIPNPEGLGEINHRDEDKTNNRVDNLEWCDRKYNINYGTRNERVAKNMVQTKINKGLVDPEMCGLTKDGDRKKYQRLRYQKNLEKMREQGREHMRKYRLKKKKNNKPSEESLW